MTRILIIKLRYIGDVLLATPVAQALRARYPKAQIAFAVHRGTEEVLRHNPHFDEILVVPRGGWKETLRFLSTLRRRRFDAVLDLTDGDRAAFLARWTGARIRIGFNDERRWRGALYTAIVAGRPGGHRIERDLSALRPIGVPIHDTAPVLVTSDADDRRAAEVLREVGVMGSDGHVSKPLVMLHPGARYWFKAWPPERFAAVANRLVTTFNARVLIGGSEQERGAAHAIATAASGSVNLAGRVDLLTFASILKRCALFIGNDNGAMHMAAALGVPIVALFGPSDPAEWGPRGQQARVLYKGLDCRACFHPTCERGEENCMRQISIEEVWQAATCVFLQPHIICTPPGVRGTVGGLAD